MAPVPGLSKEVIRKPIEIPLPVDDATYQLYARLYELQAGTRGVHDDDAIPTAVPN